MKENGIYHMGPHAGAWEPDNISKIMFQCH